MTETRYPGTELDLFQHALRWKSYWASRLSSLLEGDVLEVGAGTGNNTQLLLSRSKPRSWTCVEPDVDLFRRLQDQCDCIHSTRIHAVHGTIKDLDSSSRYDTVLYLDVLEHIEDDRTELAQAAALLHKDGHLIVLAPALPGLYSPFDAAIGHYRRYTKVALQQLYPPACRLVRIEYLDSLGILTSYANRYLLKRAVPTYSNILFWDRIVVPVSLLFDKLINRKIGKSLIAVWQRNT